MKAFHVTPRANLPSIFTHGLQPQIGERSAQRTCTNTPVEQRPRVYFFPTKNDLETALANWLGDAFDDEEALCVLVVNLHDLPLEQDCPYEWATSVPVAPWRIIKCVDEQGHAVPCPVDTP